MRQLTNFAKRKRGPQRGVGLIELILALGVLSIALAAILEMILNAAYVNNKNGKDTSSTLLAQMILEQIASQHPASTATITLTDCAGNANTVATTGATGNGAGANLDTSTSSPTYGLIDWSQSFSSIPANYGMTYVDCDPNGHQTTYDVRWNIITVSPSETRLITASARQVSSFNTTLGGGGVRFAIPVTLRAIGGP